MSELSAFIKCNGIYFNRQKNECELQTLPFYLKSSDILAVYPPEKRQLISGNEVIVFSVQLPYERMSIICKELENYFHEGLP